MPRDEGLVQKTGLRLGREEGNSRALRAFLGWFGLCRAALLPRSPREEILRFGASVSSVLVLVVFGCFVEVFSP